MSDTPALQPAAQPAIEPATQPVIGSALGRRALFTGAAALGFGALMRPGAAYSSEFSEYEPSPMDEIAPQALISRSYIQRAEHTNRAGLYYNNNASTGSYQIEDRFWGRLGWWHRFLELNVHATNWGLLNKVRHWGIYANKPGWHGQSRAIDLYRLELRKPNGDTWFALRNPLNDWPDRTTDRRRWYWVIAASLHYRFASVLTYYYDNAHRDHIHVDDGVYGTAGASNFSTGRRSQVVHAQACCRWIWGRTVAIDGIWGPETSSVTTSVLRQIGRSSGAITNSDNWKAFNLGTTRHGSYKQRY